LGTGDLQILDSDGTSTINVGHDGTYHTIVGNDVDGILIGTTGGSQNETLVLDFDASANQVVASSTSGVTNMIFLGMDVTAGLDLQASASSGDVRAGTSGLIYWNSSTEMVATADGQVTLRQSDDSTGVTLDVLTADTLTIKDQAGTGTGNLVIGSSSLTSAGLLTTAGNINSGGHLRAAAATAIWWLGRTELYSDADGQLQIEQADNTVGVTLDANDSADTLTIKDQSGTGAATLQVQSGSKGSLTTTTSTVEDITCDNSASNATSGLIPDGAFLLGVTTRITTALTGPSTGYSVGDGSDIDIYGVETTNTQGATTDNSDATANWSNPQLAAGEVTLTWTGANCTAGVVRVVAHYMTVGAPTSN
jgi:hypothetical protein